MLFNFVLCLAFLTFESVTDESFVDETRVGLYTKFSPGIVDELIHMEAIKPRVPSGEVEIIPS